MSRGVKFGRPRKLTAHQRHEAIARLSAGETQPDVARTYNVDPRPSGVCNDDADGISHQSFGIVRTLRSAIEPLISNGCPARSVAGDISFSSTHKAGGAICSSKFDAK
jgi:hypothetical protein